MDIGRISEGDTRLIVEPMNVWRERCRVRQVSAQTRVGIHGGGGGAASTALYFEGRKDRTCVGQSTGIVEEHMAVVAEPGGHYIANFALETGRATDQAQELVHIATANCTSIWALGCDRAGGVWCKLFELATERPVRWFVCQLHGNEINMRVLFKQTYGDTFGPRSFTGALGKATSGDVHRLPVAEFQPVADPLPELQEAVTADLSTDQLLLYRLARAVQTGHISDEDASRKIGPVNHAR